MASVKRLTRWALVAGSLIVVAGAATAAVAFAVAFGEVGVSVTVAAAGTIILSLLVWAGYRLLALRRSAHNMESIRIEVELARMQGDLVSALRTRLSEADHEPVDVQESRKSELDRAADRYQAVVRGLLRARVELVTVQRRAIGAYLDDAVAELRHLEEERASWIR